MNGYPMKYAKNAFLLALAVGATASQAAAIDVTAIVTDIGNQLAPIGLIGIAVMGVMVAVKAFRWVRAALS